ARDPEREDELRAPRLAQLLVGDLAPEDQEADERGRRDDEHGREIGRALERPAERPGRHPDEGGDDHGRGREPERAHDPRVRLPGGRSRQLRLRRRLRRRVHPVSLQLQRTGLRGTRDGSRRQARPRWRQRARRRRDGRPGRARRVRRHPGAALAARPLSHSPVGRPLPRRRRVARRLAETSRLPRRVARQSRETRQARDRLRRGDGRVRLPRPPGRPRTARALADSELARAAVPAVIGIPPWYAAVGPAYLAALLAVDTQVGLHWQYVLGAVTWVVRGAPLPPLLALARARRPGGAVFGRVGELPGSLIWGVYRSRLHNLPLFIPPAHGIVYLSGLALAGIVRERIVVAAAAAGAIGWGLAGLTVLPRLDVAGAFGVPLLCIFLWRSRSPAVYAGLFLVVPAL